MKFIKWLFCLAPSAAFAWWVSPMLISHGSSAAFDMAIGVPVALLVAGVVAAVSKVPAHG